MQSYKVEYFLLDRIMQGQGEMINLEKVKELAKLFPIFFAGGLDINNISEVIKKVKSYGMDVAGGIETDGKEDLGKIREFIKIAKTYVF